MLAMMFLLLAGCQFPPTAPRIAGASASPSQALPAPTPCAADAGWSEPTPPRHVFGNTSAISDKTYRYSDHPAHVAAFRAGLARVAAQPCDILLTTHVQSSDLVARLDGSKPLIDAAACKAYAERGLTGLEKRLADERAGRAP